MNEYLQAGSGYAPSRLKRVMFGLLYPAVLGTLFVTLLPATVEAFLTELGLKGIVSWLLVFHFILDYIYAEEIQNYGKASFSVDLGIVALVYLAFSMVHLGRDQPIEVRWISWAMAGIYMEFVLWHYLNRHEMGKYLVLTTYEAVIMVWFLFAGFRWPMNGVVLAGGLGVAATGLLVVGSYVLHDYHRNRNVHRALEE